MPKSHRKGSTTVTMPLPSSSSIKFTAGIEPASIGVEAVTVIVRLGGPWARRLMRVQVRIVLERSH